jgi:hypothetical protein
MNATKQQSFEDLLASREQLIAEQAKQLAELENEIRAAARAKGFAWAPLGPSGGKVSPGHASAKSKFHERNRTECIKRGWLKEDGSPDLERFRVEMKAKKLKITPAEVVKQEAAARAKRQAERFSGKR